MLEKQSARLGLADAELSKADELFARQNSQTDTERQFLPGVDECVFRLGRALRAGRLEPDSWGFNFVRSILRHCKRRGWEPSEKQLDAMRGVLADLAESDGALIDDGGDNDCAA